MSPTLPLCFAFHHRVLMASMTVEEQRWYEHCRCMQHPANHSCARCGTAHTSSAHARTCRTHHITLLGFGLDQGGAGSMARDQWRRLASCVLVLLGLVPADAVPQFGTERAPGRHAVGSGPVAAASNGVGFGKVTGTRLAGA